MRPVRAPLAAELLAGASGEDLAPILAGAEEASG